MICAHEPSLDPRIRWEAESAARHFDVTVLGFNRDDSSRPAAQAEGGYRVVHLARPAVTGLAYFWRLKDALPWAATILARPICFAPRSRNHRRRALGQRIARRGAALERSRIRPRGSARSSARFARGWPGASSIF